MNENQNSKSDVLQYSNWIFIGIILLLLWPVFTLSFLFTHDGPAHIYNACLIKQFILGNDLISGFIHFKKFPEPNWTGHFILTMLSFIFQANISERIFLGAYIILFPLFFRKLIKLVNINGGVIALLVVPFIYSYFFFGGLYNFIAGVTALFASLIVIFPLFEKNAESRYKWIFIFSLLLFLSHLLTFGVFLILICMSHVFTSMNTKTGKNFLRSSLALFISLTPSLALTIIYFVLKFKNVPGNSHMSFGEMLESLFYILPIITLKFSPENIYSLVILGLLFFILVSTLFRCFRNNENEKNIVKPFFQRPAFWGLATLLMLIFFFVIPDQAATGGVIKFRFELFFYLFLIVWIASIYPGKFILRIIPFVITGWIILKYLYFLPMMKDLDKEAQQAVKINSHMKENSILLPLNYSYNWMHDNLFNYSGAMKNIFVLDNYEAGMPHFPLEWKQDKNPVALLGNFNGSRPLCANVKNFEEKTGHKIDYIVVWNYYPQDDSCTKSINMVLERMYNLIFADGGNLKLYQRK